MQAILAPVAAAPDVQRAAAPRREPARPERDDELFGEAGPTCAARMTHDFSRVAVLGPASRVPQAKLVVGASGDRLEKEADAAAERVMRASDDDALQPLCSGCGAATDERVQRQLESPYSPDDGIVTPLAEPDEEAASVQTKTMAGAAAASPASVTPQAGAAIHALRGGGMSLPAPLRGFMESRFGHDFSRVRVHTGIDADIAARSIQARAYTLGHDVVFRAGQFDADSATGRRLIAHELAHVIQQGRAPRGAALSPAPIDREGANPSEVVRRVQWSPNKPTGKGSAPWGAGGPTGKLLKAQTDGGTALDIWRPDDNVTYWCHGYTFGGSTAKGGPYSIFGSDVPTVLKDDGWKHTWSCMSQPSDIVAFSNPQGEVMHSGIIRSMVSAGGQVDEGKSTLESKWGAAPLNTSSWEKNAKQYGTYQCYSKAPLTGVCNKGANEG